MSASAMALEMSPLKSRKVLSAERRERARDVLKTVIRRDFAGNQSHAAAKLGVTQGYLSSLVQPHTTRGMGMEMLDALSQHLHCTIEDILDGSCEQRPKPEEFLSIIGDYQELYDVANLYRTDPAYDVSFLRQFIAQQAESVERRTRDELIDMFRVLHREWRRTHDRAQSTDEEAQRAISFVPRPRIKSPV